MEFHGAAPKKPGSMSTPAAEASNEVIPIVSAGKPTEVKKNKWLLPIVGVVVLVFIGGGIAAYILTRPAMVVAPVTVCGDNKCEGYENRDSCPQDCAPKAVCGNSVCEQGETQDSCAADCAPKATCGNAVCEQGETPENCLNDCRPVVRCGDNRCDDPQENFESCPADCKPPEPTAAVDTDSDGMSDVEEAEIYKSDPLSPDTDGDSFTDYNEVVNLFDPIRKRPAELKDSNVISSLVNREQGYDMLIPSGWSVTDTDSARKSIVLISAENDTFRFEVRNKPTDQSLNDWLSSRGLSAGGMENVKSVRGQVSLLISPNKILAYADLANGRVLVATYNLGRDQVMRYRATFRTILASIRALPGELEPLPEPTEANPTASMPEETAAAVPVVPETVEPTASVPLN